MLFTRLCYGTYLSRKGFDTGAVTVAGSLFNFRALEMRLRNAHSLAFTIEAPPMI